MSFKRLFVAASFLFAVGIATPTVVSAQSDEDIKKAQGHFQKGAEWYAKGEYAKAVVEFIGGHSLAPNAMFLYNVSLSYERLGKIDDALNAAESAKKYEGMPPEVSVRNEARIQSFHLLKSAERVAKNVNSLKGEGDGDGDGDGTKPEMITRSDGIKGLGWAGLGLAAVGGGLAVAGVMTNGAIMADIPAYEDAAAAGNEAEYERLKDDLGKKQSRGTVFYAVGAGAAGVGLTLFLIDLFTGTETVPAPATAWVSGSSDGPRVGVTIRFD